MNKLITLQQFVFAFAVFVLIFAVAITYSGISEFSRKLKKRRSALTQSKESEQ